MTLSGNAEGRRESAGLRYGHITREGSGPLRVALVHLGLGLWHTEPAARAYGAS